MVTMQGRHVDMKCAKRWRTTIRCGLVVASRAKRDDTPVLGRCLIFLVEGSPHRRQTSLRSGFPGVTPGEHKSVTGLARFGNAYARAGGNELDATHDVVDEHVVLRSKA